MQPETTEFTALYKTLPHSELLKILAQSEDYNPVAVETAKQELECRALSEQELEEAKIIIKNEEAQKKDKLDKKQQQKQKILGTVFGVFDLINPIQNSVATTEKIIRRLTLIFTILSTYRIIQEFDLLSLILSTPGWDLSTVIYVLTLFVLPLATALFWMRKKAGWILLSIFLSYSIIITGYYMVYHYVLHLHAKHIQTSAMEILSPNISIISCLLMLAFWVITLWLISKKAMRNAFNVP